MYVCMYVCKDNEKVRNFQHANTIQLKYFLILLLVFAGLTTRIPCNISPCFHISNSPFPLTYTYMTFR